MIFPALMEASERGELILVTDGMCRWHKRRDDVVTIREIIVLPSRRGTGVGRQMIEKVCELNPRSPIVARCPSSYASNGFWERLGFKLTETKSSVNIWRLDRN